MAILERHLIRLHFTEATTFPHFLHGGIVQGVLRSAVGQHDFPPGVIPYAPESGRIRYSRGDPYHIGLTLIGEARALAPQIKRGLRRIGAGYGRGRPLDGNFQLESFQPQSAPDLEAAAQDLVRREEVTVVFLSPLRLLRPQEFQEHGEAFMNQQCFPGRFFLDRVLARLRRAPGVEGLDERPIPPLLSADPRGLLWIDMPVGRRKKSRAKGMTLGGVLGRVVLRGLNEECLLPLLLGGMLHVGKSVRYGLGRYTVLEYEDPRDHCFQPATSLLEQASEPEALSAALDHLLADSDAAGVDGVKPTEFARGREDKLADLSKELRKGKYRPQPLEGFLQEKRDGNPRALAFPAARDRVAQRAAAKTVGPAIDTLLEDSSYAYRKGFSREGAAQAILSAYDAGFRTVLDADIESFFDSVDWDLLFAKIRALYPFEPLVDVIHDWVRASVRFQGHVVRRQQGLPQGSPIAPLLANLYLDELDEDLLGDEFRLVRYADDFVVLCKDLNTVERARRRAQESLESLGLRLHETKTAIRSMDAGFSYLGYLFCRSVATDLAEAEDPAGPLDEKILLEIPENSWLAQLPLQVVSAIQKGKQRRTFEIVPLVEQPGPAMPARKPLYVIRSDASVRVRDERLQVHAEGKVIEEVPIRDLSHVVFVGRHRSTLPALFRLARLDVPSYFCYRSGELEAVFGPVSPDWYLWQLQGEMASNKRRRRDFARAIVQAKLHNASTLVTRFALGDADTADRIRQLRDSALNKSRMESLRGVEGQGAALFFGALRSRLDPLWGFTGRKRRPAPDPVNAMLSFGYTVLYRHLTTALQAQGLNPRLGMFHQPRGRFHALSADLQEEFRYLVDAHVWGLISRRRVSPDDFYDGGSFRGCRMKGEFLRTFIGSLQDRLATSFTPPSGVKQTYLDYLAHQTWAVSGFVAGTRQTYEPLRAHA